MSRSSDCEEPPSVIARSEPDPELAALYAELHRRYSTGHVSVYRQIQADGSSHLHISIDDGSRDGNRRRTYNLGTDTADRALCCIDKWERSLAAAKDPPLELFAACCRRCGDPVMAAQVGLGRSDLHAAKCPKCPAGTKTDIFSYTLKKDSEV